MAGRALDAASGIPDPVFRAAARRVLEQRAREQADPLAEYRIPDSEWEDARASMQTPPSAPFNAAAKGAYQALTLPARALSQIGGPENSIDALLKRRFPERHARVEELSAFRPRGPAEELGYGAGKLGVEAATLFAPAGGITGSLLQRAAGGLLKKAATNLPGRIAVTSARGVGMFGLADAARYALEQQAGGGPVDVPGTLKAAGRGAVVGAALGPAGAIGRAALRIPAEAVTMAGVSAAQEGRLPTQADVGMNLALFTMLHGIAKVPGKLQGYAAQVEILKDAFQQGRKAGADARELVEAINDMSPEVVEAFTRAVNNPEAGDVRAAAFGELDPKLAHSLQEARGLLAEARAGVDPAEVTRAEHGVRTVIREIDRQNPTLVKEWNDAVDAARALRGGAPAVPPGAETAPGATQGPESLLAGGEKAHVQETEPVDRRGQLEAEGQQLQQELQTGGLGPDQEAGIQSRLDGIRNQLAALPEPVPSRGDVAASTIEPTLEAVDRANAQRFEPTEPTTQDLRPNQMRRALGEQARGLSPQQMADRLNAPAPPELERGGPSRGVRPERGKRTLMERPGGLSYADMPQTISRAARPELKRVLAEHGIRGKRRKALMSGPDLWRRAAWEYYKATGKLPEAGIQAHTRAAETAAFPEAPRELVAEAAETKTTQAVREGAPVQPPEKRAEPRSPLAVNLHSAVARAERAETPKLQKEAYRLAHQALFDEVQAFMRREGIPSERVELAFAQSSRLNELNERLNNVQSAIFTREMAEQEAARPPAPREEEKPPPTPTEPKPTPTFTYVTKAEYGKRVIHYWKADVDMPDGGGKAGSMLTAEVIARNGFDVPPVPGEAGVTIREATLRPRRGGIEVTPGETTRYPPAEPTIDEILAGKHNTIATREDYEKARATLKELAKGVKISAGINTDALAALFKIGEYHLERLIRAGAQAGKDLYDRWASAIRLELEDVDATISDDRLRWMWENPDIRQTLATVEKETANAPSVTRTAGTGQGQPEPVGGRKPAEKAAQERAGGELPGGARAPASVGGARHESERPRAEGEPGNVPRGTVPGDRGKPGVQGQVAGVRAARTDWTYPRGASVELSKADRRATNDAVREILKRPASDMTDADRETLSQYTGLGGLGDTEDRGFLFQHYTSVPVAQMLWDKLDRMGWKGKRVLEPSVGSGVFLGTKPPGVKVTGIELDDTAGEVARRLYPEQDIRTQPFETFTEGEGKYDLVIGNPSFEEVRNKLRWEPEAKAYKDINALHDFFITKGIDQLKPGGVLAQVVSTGFLDKLNQDTRARIFKDADLVTAYRLPSGTFSKNAHTDVTVDMLIFRKRGVGEEQGSSSWLVATPKTFDVRGEDRQARVNNYYDTHPTHVLGQLRAGLGRYASQVGVEGKLDADNINELLNDGIRLAAPPAAEATTTPMEAPKPVGALQPGVRIGQYVLGKRGAVLVATPSGMAPYVKETRVAPSPEKMAQAVELLDVADTVRSLMVKGHGGKVATAQAGLRLHLDAWMRKHGNPHEDRRLMKALRADPRRGLLRSLIRPSGVYADIVTKPTIFSSKYASKPVDTGDIDAAALEAQRKNGVITVPGVLAVYTGKKFKTPEQVRAMLEDDPTYNRTASGWLHDSEYLYGNIRERMDEARSLGEKGQLEKLRAVLPPQETVSTFKFSLAAGWMDKEVHKAFVQSLALGDAHYYRNRWEIIKDRDDIQSIAVPLRGVVADKEAIQTTDLTWNKAVEYRMNGVQVAPRPPRETEMGWVPGITIQQAEASNRVLKQVDQIFDKWVRSKGSADSIVEDFNRKFKARREKEFAQDIAADAFSTERFKTIHPWQAIPANMQLDRGRGINALNVGLGKTLSQILTAISGKAQGLHQKPLIVVPGNVQLKWEDEFLSAFPDSKILNLGNLGAGMKRGELLNTFANNDWDAGVVTYEGFQSIHVSPERHAAFLQRKVDEMRAELAALPDAKKGKNKRGRGAREAQIAIDKFEARIAKLLAMEKGKELWFDDLGVDAVFVDEAHNFRRVPYYATGLAGRLNLGQGDAERALAMQMKLEHVLESNGMRGAYFATATPTPNTPIEIFTMLDHIAPDMWKSIGIHGVNDFLTSFAEVENVAAVDVEGHPTTRERVAYYKNWDSLQDIVRRFVYMRNTKEVRQEFPGAPFSEPRAKVVTTMLDPSPETVRQATELKERLKRGPRTDEERKGFFLRIIGAARQIAAHPALYDGRQEDYRDPNNKLDAIAKAVTDNYRERQLSPFPLPEDEPDHPGFNGHVVFLDAYGKSAVDTGKLKKNLHEHLRDRLVELGIPAEEIAIVNGESNNAREAKKKLQDDYNAGKLRVLIGSTPAMGEGMDLQRISTNLYHWDSQWNPGAMQQREGRVVRQGNKLDEVKVERFVQRMTFDSFFYGLLAQKQRWLESLWKSNVGSEFRNEADVGEEAIGFEEIMQALAGTEAERAFFGARGQVEQSAARRGILDSDVKRMENEQARVAEEVREREDKIEDYLKRRKESKNEEAYETHIVGHREALENLGKSARALKLQMDASRLELAQAIATQKLAAESLKDIEGLQEEMKRTGVDYGTILLRRTLPEAPEAFRAPAFADAYLRAIAATKDEGLLVEAQRRHEDMRSTGNGIVGLLQSPDTFGDVARKTWRELYGVDPPKVLGPRNVGAASGSEMARARRTERRLLVQQAKELGITAPVQTAAPEAKGPRMERTAQPHVRHELDELERERIGEDGTLSDDAAAKLGRRAIDPAEYEKLSQGEKVVHVLRRVEAARNPKHLDNIVASKKFKVWTWSKGDQEALTTAIGLRTVGMGYDEAPPELRGALKRSDDEAAAEVDRLRAETKKWVFSLFPAEHNLGGLGIVEGHGGMREAFQVIAHEKQLWDQWAKTHYFRDPKGKLMKRGDLNDRTIFELANNAAGAEEGIDRPTITLQDGTEVTPEPWHRERAREWQKFYNEFADRQELPDERRIPNYMHHIIDRRLALEPATPKDRFAIHAAARRALEANYDAAELNAALPKDLKRNKALQLLDVLNRQKGAPSMKWLKRRIDVILAADETVGIPRELFIPHLQRRRGGTPYLESAIESFEAYVPYALRKIYLEPAVLHAKPVIEAMVDRGSLTFLGVGVQSQRAYAEDYINSVLGRPPAADRGLDSIMAGFNDATKGHLLNVPVLWRLFKPNLATRSISALTRIQYFRLLGLAVDSALTNITQGVNTLAQFGLRDTLKGYVRLLDPRFWKELHQEKLLGEYKQMFTGPIAPWEHPLNVIERVALSPFTFAEFVNRGAAFAAGLSAAKRSGMSFERSQQMGLGAVSRYLMQNPVTPSGILDRMFGAPEASKIFYTSPGLTSARGGVLKTQFGYSPAESAPTLRTPSGRFLFQFWNYPTRQSAMIWRGMQSGMQDGEYLQFARFLALLGATVTAPLLYPPLKNLWSIWSLWPRDFGPNATMSYLLWQAITGDKDAPRKLERQLYLKGGGLRFFDKIARHGEEAVLPFTPPVQTPSRARPSRHVERPSHAYGGHRR